MGECMTKEEVLELLRDVFYGTGNGATGEDGRQVVCVDYDAVRANIESELKRVREARADGG